MALVVCVCVAMTALANGFRSALSSTGADENVLVLRKGANQEMYSGISRQTASIIAGYPFVAQGPDGLPLVSAETFVVIPLERATGGMANVVARGVGLNALDVRRNIEV